MDRQQVLEWEFSNVGSMCLQDGMQKVKVGPRFWWPPGCPSRNMSAMDRGVDWVPGNSQHGQCGLCERGWSSVQLKRSLARNVLMVRRRSTVRFRNGAPGHKQFSNDSNEWRGTSPGDALQPPLQRKLPLHSENPGRQLMKGAVGGPSWDNLVTVRARSRWVDRPASRRRPRRHRTCTFAPRWH